jgi:hypothetical protein
VEKDEKSEGVEKKSREKGVTRAVINENID